MQLTKLTLQAFGPFLEKHTLNLMPDSEKGLLLICSPGGSGKSSLIKAFFYALFGTKSLNKKEIVTALLRHHQAGSKTPTTITLDFRIAEISYRLTRFAETRKGYSYDSNPDYQDSLESLEGGKTQHITRGESEVTRMVQKLLGAISEDYIKLALPSFNDGNTAISIHRGISKAFLKRLFNANYLEKIWQNILTHGNMFLRAMGEKNHCFLTPKDNDTNPANDYYSIKIKSHSSNALINAEELSAGIHALLLFSIHLAIIRTLIQTPGISIETCLFLDRFLELLDQETLRKFIQATEEINLNHTPIVVTSSNPKQRLITGKNLNAYK